jgi:hypothetical protein
MRGLEVPPEVVESLGQGKRPRVTITINGHSWKSRVAIMRGRFLLGLSNANRQAAGVDTGDEVEVELEFDPDPVSWPSRRTSPAPSAPIQWPAPRMTACPMGANGSTCAPSRAQRSRRRARGESRRHWPRCGTRSPQGAPWPAGGPEPRRRRPASPKWTCLSSDASVFVRRAVRRPPPLRGASRSSARPSMAWAGPGSSRGGSWARLVGS